MRDYSIIRGFNYQPSYGSNGFEIWQKFDAAIIDKEISLGKQHFPKMNAVRIWLSWDSFNRNQDRYKIHFGTILDIMAKYDLLVMPVLFNRWHDSKLDYGGIYIDHFLQGASWIQRRDMFTPYLEAVAGEHSTDPRIFAWDLCQESFWYPSPENLPDMVKAEHKWLEQLYITCKQLRPQSPLTFGIHMHHGIRGIEQIEPISDILSIHPYCTADSPPHKKSAYEELLDEYVTFAAKVKKPLLASETCWGSLEDEKRVSTIRYTLEELKRREIGWLAYLLHHSLVADAHRPEFGPVGAAGNMSFIEADGKLRLGHEVFNEY